MDAAAEFATSAFRRVVFLSLDFAVSMGEGGQGSPEPLRTDKDALSPPPHREQKQQQQQQQSRHSPDT